MEQNPFEYQGPLSELEIEFLNREEDLDLFFSNLRKVTSLSYEFNPLHHRFFNQLFFKLTERRKVKRPSAYSEALWNWRYFLAHVVMDVRVRFMTKTISIREAK